MIRQRYILILLLVPSVAMAERVFSEALLNSWGYETTRLEERHIIKSLDNKSNTSKAFYARFELWRECLDNPEMATEKIKSIEEERKSTLIGLQKNYQRTIQARECIYYVRSWSNHTYLSYQPELMKRIRAYVSR